MTALTLFTCVSYMIDLLALYILPQLRARPEHRCQMLWQVQTEETGKP